MLNLSLIIHAKSDWENFDGDDMSRSIALHQEELKKL